MAWRVQQLSGEKAMHGTLRMTDLSHTLLAQLVAINSVNPAYGGPGEAAVAAFIGEQLARAGIEVFRQPIEPGRENVIGVLPGRDRSRRVVLEAHMDTVGVERMSVAAFTPTVCDGHLFGRGSCDTKGGLAGMLAAVLDLAATGQQPGCDVWLAAVVDEEHAYRGVLGLVDGLATAGGTTAAAIVAEPTSLRIVSATKGVLRFLVRLQGRAAHSSKPWLGASAITAAAEVVLALDRLHTELTQATSHPLLGPATGSIGLIHGGVQVNIVPEACELSIDRRLLPGEEPEIVLAGYREVIDATLATSPVSATIAVLLLDETLETPADSEVIATAADVCLNLDLEPTAIGVPYGSDASKLSRRAGVPSIVFGPGSIDQAHAADESVPLDEVATAAAFYREFLVRFGSAR
jgi:acetylornithine deacetylase/succinyl-diaminopimelate desuccinylase-like protein